MPFLLAAVIGFIVFTLEVGIATGLVALIAWLIGASLSGAGAFGIGLGIILVRNLIASAVK